MLGTKILEERESKYNGNLRVVKTIGLGIYIQANGLTQSGGIVKTLWKQTLNKVHQSLATNHQTLILGLGGGTAAMLVRKFWPDAKITAVDIDPIMVELGKKHLGLGQVSINIILADAYEFSKKLKVKSEKFDLIVVDLYNSDQFPDKFGDVKFLTKLKNSLSGSGVAIFNRTYYGDKRPEAVKFGNKLQKIFPSVEWFYPEANLMFLCRRQI